MPYPAPTARSTLPTTLPTRSIAWSPNETFAEFASGALEFAVGLLEPTDCRPWPQLACQSRGGKAAHWGHRTQRGGAHAPTSRSRCLWCGRPYCLSGAKYPSSVCPNPTGPNFLCSGSLLRCRRPEPFAVDLCGGGTHHRKKATATSRRCHNKRGTKHENGNTSI